MYIYIYTVCIYIYIYSICIYIATIVKKNEPSIGGAMGTEARTVAYWSKWEPPIEIVLLHGSCQRQTDRTLNKSTCFPLKHWNTWHLFLKQPLDLVVLFAQTIGPETRTRLTTHTSAEALRNDAKPTVAEAPLGKTRATRPLVNHHLLMKMAISCP